MSETLNNKIDYKNLTIRATNLPDAWFQTVYACLEKGRDFKIDRGSYEGDKRLEFDHIVVNIKNPGNGPLLPETPAQYNLPNPVPGGRDYVDDYAMNYLLGSELKEGESYTYGQRLTKYPLGYGMSALHFQKDINIPEITQKLFVDNFKELPFLIKEETDITRPEITNPHDYYVDQIKLVIWTYKNKGHRNNQLVMQVAHPADLLLKDPPCLRHIDTRIQDGRLHFIVYFRSWDLWGGFPANLAAIQLMKEYMAAEIGVGDGSLIASSKGLHLYSYVWELAEIIRGKTIEEFRNG